MLLCFLILLYLVNSNKQQPTRARNTSAPNIHTRGPGGIKLPPINKTSLQSRISNPLPSNNNDAGSVQELINDINPPDQPGTPSDSEEPPALTGATPPGHAIYIPDYSEPPTDNNTIKTNNNDIVVSRTVTVMKQNGQKRELDITERFNKYAQPIPISPAVIPTGPKKKQKKSAITAALNHNETSQVSPAPSIIHIDNQEYNKGKKTIKKTAPATNTTINLITPPPVNNKSVINKAVITKKVPIEDSYEKFDTVNQLIHDAPSCINTAFTTKDFPELNLPALPASLNANKFYRSFSNAELDQLIGEKKTARAPIYPAECMENTCALIFDQIIKFFAANPYRTEAEAISRKLFLEDISTIIRIGFKGRNPSVVSRVEEQGEESVLFSFFKLDAVTNKMVFSL